MEITDIHIDTSLIPESVAEDIFRAGYAMVLEMLSDPETAELLKRKRAPRSAAGRVQPVKIWTCRKCGEEYTAEDLKELRDMGERYHKTRSSFLCPDCTYTFDCMDLEDQFDELMGGDSKR